MGAYYTSHFNRPVGFYCYFLFWCLFWYFTYYMFEDSILEDFTIGFDWDIILILFVIQFYPLGSYAINTEGSGINEEFYTETDDEFFILGKPEQNIIYKQLSKITLVLYHELYALEFIYIIIFLGLFYTVIVTPAELPPMSFFYFLIFFGDVYLDFLAMVSELDSDFEQEDFVESSYLLKKQRSYLNSNSFFK